MRQHLNALRSGGYVASRQVRGQPGRPADRYHATELTEPLFATTDNSLSVELLTLIEEEDPELVNRVFERRRRRLIDRAERQLADEPIDRQVSAVAALLDAEGYLADSEKLGEHRYQIRLHSCAIWPVARQYGQACNAELDFICDLIPGATVERTTHKAAGAHTVHVRHPNSALTRPTAPATTTVVPSLGAPRASPSLVASMLRSGWSLGLLDRRESE